MSIKINAFSLYKKIIKNYYNNNSFVVFRMPNDNKIFFYSHCKKYKIKKYSNFFFIQDFYNNFTIEIIPEKIYYIDIQYNTLYLLEKQEKNSHLIYNSYKYKKILENAIKHIIKIQSFEKVVLSRYIEIPFKNFSFKETFEKLIFSYPNTLTSIWYDVNFGIWIGSTPELLMKCVGKKIITEALAGTINCLESNKWTIKEIEEHNIVVKYIVFFFRKYYNYRGILNVENTQSIKIGNLKHLKTVITFSFFKKPNFYKILKKLHPTPSICGYPKIKSLEYIKMNEKYNRSFYTGIIGIGNKKNMDMELYINLRCAKIITSKKIIFYAGSGVTAKSSVIKEYIETENKIKSILSKFFFR
ncbi:chorismate-binding protein [Blattabacterium cuenoti]|uniref:chorismate-binding protein n=1 Tax=Blattabacterium cuenoti TaxID=1653831 RepID=UPI00163D0F52|nr:chorismate-binding protein [Blattabacterium cuenoti]